MDLVHRNLIYDHIFNHKFNINKNIKLSENEKQMDITITDKRVVRELIASSTQKRLTLTFLKAKEMMNEGSFGSIYSYKNDEFNTYIILKKEKMGQGYESKISKTLRKNQCDIIRSIPLGDYILMPKADGTIHGLMNKNILAGKSINYHKKFALSVGNEILEQIKCLNRVNYKYIYTDIHLANIFYTHNSDDTLRIQLGDFGSMLPPVSEIYSFTMCPAEYLNREIDFFEGNMCKFNTFRPANASNADKMEISKLLSFLIGIFLLYLIVGRGGGRGLWGGHRWGDLFHSEKYDKYIELLDTYYLGTKKKILGNLIAKDPNDRPDLRKMTLMEYIDSKSGPSSGEEEERKRKIRELRARHQGPTSRSRSRSRSRSTSPKTSQTKVKSTTPSSGRKTLMGDPTGPGGKDPTVVYTKPHTMARVLPKRFPLSEWLKAKGHHDKYGLIRSNMPSSVMDKLNREELYEFYKKYIPEELINELIDEQYPKIKSGATSKRKKRNRKRKKSRNRSRKRKKSSKK